MNHGTPRTVISKVASMLNVPNIKRVVSVFILRPNVNNPTSIDRDVAVFRRCPTMPTFANHWAGISGSIEEADGSPLEAALRELEEETNIVDVFADFFSRNDAEKHFDSLRGDNSRHESLQMRLCLKAGLHIDIPKKDSEGAFGELIIRVYPFALILPMQSLCVNLEMRGTEHDQMKFISIGDFFDLTPCVPGLQTAFHHATAGAYLQLPSDVRAWENDRVNGAAYLARKAVSLATALYPVCHSQTVDDAHNPPNILLSMAMLRPSMVPIVNAMREIDRRLRENTQFEDLIMIQAEILQSLDSEAERCVNLAVETIMNDYIVWQSTTLSSDFVIGTFSRSSTLKRILERLLQTLPHPSNAKSIKVVCSQSSPGNEGELMANDIPNATCVSDTTFHQLIKQGKINLVIIGADCILSNQMGIVNKIGTAALAHSCKSSIVPIKCFSDRWKVWDDIYAPPLEEIFEVVTQALLDSVVVPSDPLDDE
ncbi:hypothetical protein HJC23_004276 [Cyclotella cryptica]|uniref:Nudix hydrolase domain-containing protein n=1 Tax=Cyclotella cryptica TaxID=29204 RepID=A0ABD3Q4I8_9STRA|eukprot:CCRYP_008883-RA/>CCRYP_008883-RA protein AED:0.01 eAED:0.01 QI:322/1/1/1/1/1/2/479/482